MQSSGALSDRHLISSEPCPELPTADVVDAEDHHVTLRSAIKGRSYYGYPFDLPNMDLDKQVRMLRGELASLQELAAGRGKNVYDAEAMPFLAITTIWPGLRHRSCRGLGKRGRMVGAAAFNHPAAVAAVGLLVVGLVVSLFLTQRLSERTRQDRAEVSGNGRDQELLPKAQLPKEPLTQEMLRLEAPSVRMALRRNAAKSKADQSPDL